MLEPDDGKLSHTVLIGERGSNPSDLLDCGNPYIYQAIQSKNESPCNSQPLKQLLVYAQSVDNKNL